MIVSEARIKIGHKFKYYASKRKDIYTVVDIYITKAIASGEVVKIEYLTEHDFMGQTVTALMPEFSIVRSEAVEHG